MQRPEILAYNNGKKSNKNNFQKKHWLDLQYNDAERTIIKKPSEFKSITVPFSLPINEEKRNRIKGSMIGMTIGDALGAHVEFRPREYLIENPVYDLEGGGTWGLQKGQFTDDTSMALCLANSLVAKRDFNLYDQLVRYKWWYEDGYMSSTGECFDIGEATRNSLEVFKSRQKQFAEENELSPEQIDYLSDVQIEQFNVYCSEDGVAGNGALMRLAPVPLFFYRFPKYAVKYSGLSGLITHGDRKVYDACRYYGALIAAALRGYTKEQLFDKEFYSKHKDWFGDLPLCDEIRTIAEGSYQREGGYDDGIRGKGYIVNALEAALWAFWSDQNSFRIGALAAVNLGDDTDTTAAIYGQLAGAYYGYESLPKYWVDCIYAKKFIESLCEWITYESKRWKPSRNSLLMLSSQPFEFQSKEPNTEISKHMQNSYMQRAEQNNPATKSYSVKHKQHKKDRLDQSAIEHREIIIESRANPPESSTVETLRKVTMDHNDTELNIASHAHHDERVKERSIKTESPNDHISTRPPKSSKRSTPTINGSPSTQIDAASNIEKKKNSINNLASIKERIHPPHNLARIYSSITGTRSYNFRNTSASNKRTNQNTYQALRDGSSDNFMDNTGSQDDASTRKSGYFKKRAKSAPSKTKSKN